jgi:hypothetical protein
VRFKTLVNTGSGNLSMPGDAQVTCVDPGANV